jgi:uncharacterized protein
MSSPPRPGDLVALDASECIALLEDAPWVRIGFVADGGPTVLPINVVLHDGDIYFRTAVGSKLGSAAGDGKVAIQADGGDLARRVGWSVVVHGSASIVTDPEIEEALFALPFEPWALPDDKPFWICVEVDEISGRRILRS